MSERAYNVWWAAWTTIAVVVAGLLVNFMSPTKSTPVSQKTYRRLVEIQSEFVGCARSAEEWGRSSSVPSPMKFREYRELYEACYIRQQMALKQLVEEIEQPEVQGK